MGYVLESRLRQPGIVVVFVALPVLVLWLAAKHAHVSTIVLIVFLLGCAVLAAQAFLSPSGQANYPTRIRGVGVGAAVAVGRIGSIVGPKLGGALKAAGHSSAQLLHDILPIVIAGSVCALWLAWHAPKQSSIGSGVSLE